MKPNPNQLYATDYGTLLSTFSFIVSTKNSLKKLLETERKGAIAPDREKYLVDSINEQQHRVDGMYHYLVQQFPYIGSEYIEPLAKTGLPVAYQYEPVSHSKDFVALPMKQVLEHYMASDDYDIVRILIHVEAVVSYDILKLFLYGNTDNDIEYSLKELSRGVSYAIHPALNVMKMFKPSI